MTTRSRHTSTRRKASTGVKHWLSGKLGSKEDNIFNFTIPKNLESKIVHDVAAHEAFKKFTIETIKKVSLELDNDSGDIITVHSFIHSNAEYNAYLEKLKAMYNDMYLKDLQTASRTATEKRHLPEFSKDLLLKNNLQYEKFEKETGISKSLEYQDDVEFYKSLGDRITGLDKCMKDPNEIDERKEYYRKQHESEANKMVELDAKTDMPPNNKISEMCKVIYWNKETLDLEPSKFDYAEFETFLNANDKLELKFLRTFIPDEYFNLYSNGEVESLNEDKFKELVNSKNRTYRQYQFGFRVDMDKFWPFRSFIYELQSINDSLNYTYMCDKFTNWNIFLNLFYDKCAVSNLDVDFPARISLTTNDIFFKNGMNRNDGFNIRYVKQQYNLFDKSQTAFVGLIIIKNYHITKGQKRLMILYVFKNLNKDSGKFDFITGTIPDFFSVNADMEMLNEGALITHPSVTYNEFKHFYYMTQSEGLFLYGSELDENAMFLTKKSDIPTRNYYAELKLYPLDITMDKNDIILKRKTVPVASSGGGIGSKFSKKVSRKLKKLTKLRKFKHRK